MEQRPQQISIARAILEHLARSRELLIYELFPRFTGDFLPNTYPRRQPHEIKHKSRLTQKHTLSSILSRLKQEGLVTNNGPHNKKQWRITSRGRIYLKKRPPQQKFMKISTILPADGILRLVSFDIPEKERAKRKWLRKELLGCGYNSLHKSVFVGTRPLPKEMIQEIDFLQIGHYVHIAAVEKSGTIVRHHSTA